MPERRFKIMTTLSTKPTALDERNASPVKQTQTDPERLVLENQRLVQELEKVRYQLEAYQKQLDQRAVVTDKKLERGHGQLKEAYEELTKTYTELQRERESLAQTNQALADKVHKLSLIESIGQATRATVDLTERLDILLDGLIQWMKVDQAMFFLTDDARHHLCFAAGSQPLSPEFQNYFQSVPLGKRGGMLAKSVREKRSYVINSSLPKWATEQLVKRLPLKFGAIVPLVTKKQVVGIIVIDNSRLLRPLNEGEMRSVKLFASHSALAVENAQLYADLSVKNRRSEKELKMAYAVQEGFLPQHSPQIDQAEIAGKSIPARMVGGDFYTFRGFRRGDDKFGVGIGDVSGKGVSAALLMSMTVSVLDTYNLIQAEPINPLFASLNKSLREHMARDSDMFVTLFYGIFDFKRKLLTYAKAGHDAPLVIRQDGSWELLEARGTILGRFKECQFEIKQVALEPGMRFVFYTDGVTEAMNKRRSQFGIDRLCELVERCQSVNPTTLVKRVFDRVKRFRGSEPQHDDLTMVVVDIKT